MSSPGFETFADRLQVAIAARGVSLAWLRNRLAEVGSPVALSTLSYWRTGQRHPEGASSLAAVDALEEVLGLDAGELRVFVRPRRTGPLPVPEVPIDDEAIRLSMAESLAIVGGPSLDSLRELATHIVVVVDEHGRLRRRQVRAVVQAVSGTLHHLAWVEVAESPTDSPPRITDLAGVTVTRTDVRPDRMVRSYLLALENPVVPPDTAVMEWTVEFDEDYPVGSAAGHFVARPARETLIWVRFDARCLPQWCEEQVDGEPARPLPLGSGHGVHAARTGFGPGVLIVRWGFSPRGTQKGGER